MERKKLALVTTVIGSGVVLLDGTAVNLALPNISTSLHASFSDLQWIIDGYLLTLSSLILIGGSLGDILGRKKIYMLGLAGFGLSSLLIGLAPSAGSVIGLRLVQGVFGAMLVPGGLAIINTNFPKEERGKAIGQWAAWLSIFGAVGPLLGGWLVDIASWRWIFLINFPLALLCWALAGKSIEESRDKEPRRIDWVGAGLTALMLGSVTFALIEGPVRHWNMLVISLLVASALFAAIFLKYESHSKDPMVHLSLFRSRNFTGANLMTLWMYGALSGFMFSLVIYLQTKMGYSPIMAGLSLLPIPFMLLLFSGRMGSLSAKLGARYFLTIGPLVCALAMLLLKSYHPGDGYLMFLLPRVLLFGFGMVIFVAPLTAAVMSSVPVHSSGIASGINNAVARIGGLIVIALLGLLGASQLYQFGLGLSAGLAAAAGIISFLLIRNPKKV